jgi:hypothetical protein
VPGPFFQSDWLIFRLCLYFGHRKRLVIKKCCEKEW